MYMTQAMISVTDLMKRYGGKAVVKKISFSVEQGEIFGILGPNGAGKTTTLEMIETIRPIDGGKVMINGLDVSREQRAVKQLIGVQPQTASFEEKTKLTETLEFFASTYGKNIHAAQLLKDVELLDKAAAYPEQLSGGQRQRFSIAVALVHQPKVLFLDEPTTGLDPQARRHIWGLVQAIRKKGVTIIMTSHYMEEAELLCDRVAIMDKGRIIALDTPQQLVKDLLAKGFKKQQHVEQASLDDVFIDLTGKALRD